MVWVQVTLFHLEQEEIFQALVYKVWILHNLFPPKIDFPHVFCGYTLPPPFFLCLLV